MDKSIKSKRKSTQTLIIQAFTLQKIALKKIINFKASSSNKTLYFSAILEQQAVHLPLMTVNLIKDKVA